MNEEPKDIVASFKSSVLSDELGRITEIVTEPVIDSILNEGMLRDFPIIGASLGLYKIGASLKARNDIKKLCKFLFQLNDIPKEERSEFVNKLERGRNQKNELFERILYIIERLDDIDKAEIIGKLFNSLVKDKLKTDDFLRISAIIERTYLTDLKYLDIRFNRGSKIDHESKIIFLQQNDSKFIEENLTLNGIMKREQVEDYKRQRMFGLKEKQYKDMYKLTNIGLLLVENGFSNIPK